MRGRSYLILLAVIAGGVLVFGAITRRQVATTESLVRLADLRLEVEEIEEELARLDQEIGLLLSRRRVATEARERLGMRRAKDDEIVLLPWEETR